MTNELEAEIAELAARARGNGGRPPVGASGASAVPDPHIFARQTPEARAVREAFETAARKGIEAAELNLARAYQGKEKAMKAAEILRTAGEDLAAQLDWPQPKA